MSERFNASEVLKDLTPFQRNTVEHIIQRFYAAHANRFLVADETGLGKTLVARGVIARTIEELEHDDTVDRIDIVYVCSNTDLAQQNLRKLNVTGNELHNFASRLTLLAKVSRDLEHPGSAQFTKPVNLISFTPGTSFEKGWRSGKAEERAMLFLLLQELPELELEDRRRARAAYELLKGGVADRDRFKEQHVEPLRRELKSKGGLDRDIATNFREAARRKGLIDRFQELSEEILQRRRPEWNDVWRLVGDLRSTLARESVLLLEPDLVILDEFQRFRHLLDDQTEAGELAHYLFNYGTPDDRSGHPTAKTLLLSATPYKPFTYAEEGEDHHTDFMEVLRWLSTWSDGDPTVEIEDALTRYRAAVIAGRPVRELATILRERLITVMTRSERPRQLTETMTWETCEPVDGVSPESLLGYVALKDLARMVDAPMNIEYWKSSPYFANFMEGYKVGDRVREALKDPDRAEGIRAQLRKTRHLDFDRVAALAPLVRDNARLNRLARETVDRGWWKLLWLPPSLPYLKPAGPYQEIAEGGHLTKRLVFSSWAATPTAIASLLSYEADRLGAGPEWSRKTPEERETERRSRPGRLRYRMDRDPDHPDRADHPATMALLALFWPMPGLAELADPLMFRGRSPGPVDADELVGQVASQVGPNRSGQPGAKVASHWFEAFARPDSLPPGATERDAPDIARWLAGRGDEAEPDSQDGTERVEAFDTLRQHVSLALQVHTMAQTRAVTEDVRRAIAEVAAHSPANITYRALRRVTRGHPVSPGRLWCAAAFLGSAFQTLFRRAETTLLLDQLMPGEVYWRAVLRYCAAGDLQAVMDEYLHHLASQCKKELDDDALLTLVSIASNAISLRPVRYDVFNPDDPDSRPTLSARFALRYGSRRQDQESARQPQVRDAFNSPFWPFVLATTSVGQEGIDLHWWCHSVVHWNTPPSPVDFEQREGRVDRYDGHAIRRNIAQRHEDAILRSGDPNPWAAAYCIAREHADPRLGHFAPHWVYDGDAKIERHVAPYALSRDKARLERVKKGVALYRLTFGQPRQEDMLELLEQQYRDASPEDLAAMRVDLTAPQANGTGG